MLLRIAIVLALVVAGSASTIIAQESRNAGTTLAGQITGQVRYAAGGQPAFNVLVSCDSFNAGHIGQEFTDRSGRFRFSNLAPSQYNVTVRVAGFVEERQTAELLTSPTAYLQFQLRSDGSSQPGGSNAAMASSNVPAAAQKEFDEASAILATGKTANFEDAV